MAKAGLIGGSYMQRSLPFDAQRSINLFPMLDKEGKEVASLYGTPGLALFGSVASGPGRGGFVAASGRTFAVIGAMLYELASNGTTTARGALDQSEGNVTMAENGLQLAVCDGTSLYIFTYSSNAYAKVVTANLPSASSVDFIDGYFVVSRSANSGIFQISSLYDGTTWAALDFATAESSPDSLLRVLNVSGQLWLMGSRTTEVWANTGALNFPFQKISGAAIQSGTMATYAAIALDNSAFWVGNDTRGNGIVNRADGLTPQRISTETIERRIQAAPYPITLKLMAYQEEGHTFLLITGGGMETALCYDLATKLWHERAYLQENGTYGLPLQTDLIFTFGKQLALDRLSGNIYWQSLDFYSDNGNAIPRDRTFTHISNENQRIQFPNLTVGFESGVGLESGQGSNPQAILSLSNDGGRTFFGNYSKSIGRVGQYQRRCKWSQLGMARERTFRVRVTDPVPVHITGAYWGTKN